MDERTALLETSKTFAAALQGARGSESKERAACQAAVASYMRIKQEAGAPKTASPMDLNCAEFFAEGEGDIDSAFTLITGAADDDVSRWWQLLADAAGY